MGLTNKEAAEILKRAFAVELDMYNKYLDYTNQGLDITEALKKAIDVLEKTPDYDIYK